MASIRKTNSTASQPLKAGEAPVKTTPKVTFEAVEKVAVQKLDALVRGGVECVTFISAAFLCGYLARTEMKIKLDVMRDTFALDLKKTGLGGTQTKKYLDYAFKLSGMMFKECQYGMEIAALLAADTPDACHAAVKAYLHRKTHGAKSEHGYLLTDAGHRLNVLGVFLKLEDDPSKPETLPGTDAAGAAIDPEKVKRDKARKASAARIEKDPEILKQVPADKIVAAVANVVSFSSLVVKHVNVMADPKKVEAEMNEIVAAYKARLKVLTAEMGKKAKPEKKAKAA